MRRRRLRAAAAGPDPGADDRRHALGRRAARGRRRARRPLRTRARRVRTAAARGRTVVGLATPRALVDGDQLSDNAATLVSIAERSGTAVTGPARTLLGGVGQAHAGGLATLTAGTPATATAQAPVGGQQPARTLVGIARPGIAPTAPGVSHDDDDLEPMSELGATMAPRPHVHRLPRPEGQAVPLPRQHRSKDKERARAHDPKRSKGKPRPKARSNRAIILGAIAGALVVGAVAVALLFQGSAPLALRPKADAQGHEGVEVTCASCPDGTKLTINGATATVAEHVALVPLSTALTVGDNKLKVAIDRPGDGRDETVTVVAHVGYRVRPDLATLQGDKPAISIIGEASAGTTISLDGKPMQLTDGRGLERIELADALASTPEDVKTLARQVPYVVTPPDGPPESGVVAVTVGIVALHVDAPGPRITTDKSTFVLAGHAARGAEVLAAGKPIPVKEDGTFAQVMNVSAVGATQIEVRAKLPGMAPRILPIRVRRVESLDAAAAEFAATEQPVDFAAMGVNDKAAIGKPVALAGEILEVRRQGGYQSIVLLDVAKSSGCTEKSCPVRLVIGVEPSAKKGDKVRAFGRVAPPFTAGGAAVPEVDVEFLVGPGDGRAGAKAGSP